VRKKKRHRRDDPNASADRKHRHAKQAMELERRVSRLGTSKKLGDAKDSQKTKKGATDAETVQLKALIRDVYQRRNPSKLGELDALFKKYAGSEGDVYSHVCKKYGETPNLKRSRMLGIKLQHLQRVQMEALLPRSQCKAPMRGRRVLRRHQSP